MPLSGHGMEKFGIFLTHFDVSGSTPLLPVQILQVEQLFQMQFNNFPEVEFLPKQRPNLLQVVQQQNDLNAIRNKQLHP